MMKARVVLQLIAVTAVIAATAADDTAGWTTVPLSGTPRICFANVSHGIFVCETDREIIVDCGSLDDGRHAFELLVVASGLPGMHELDEINVMLQRYCGIISMLHKSSSLRPDCAATIAVLLHFSHVHTYRFLLPRSRRTPYPGHSGRLLTEH